MGALAERRTATESARLHNPHNVLTLDIERTPGRARVKHRGLTITGDFWDLSSWKHTLGYRIHPDDVLEWPTTICAAWHWYGHKAVEFASVWDDGHDGMHQRIWDAYDRAQVLYGHNVDNFDTKHLNEAWLQLGLPEPSPRRPLDTLKEARKAFAFESNTLASLTKRLGIDTKTDKYDVATARAAVAGDKKAQRKLKAYNIGDIHASREFVDRLRGWIPSHPHSLTSARIDDNGVMVPTCNQCWGENLELNGTKSAVVLTYPLYRCRDCGANVQATRHSVRTASTRGAR